MDRNLIFNWILYIIGLLCNPERIGYWVTGGKRKKGRRRLPQRIKAGILVLRDSDHR